MWNTYLDQYCERLAPGLWAEPLNALTNGAFFIAAYMAYYLAQKRGVLTPTSLSLIAIIIVIGAGSTAFHTFATYWAMLSDVLPILAYQIVFLMLYSRNVIGLGCAKRAGLLALFLATIFSFGRLPSDWLNGSLQYAPALLFVGGLGVYHWWTRKREAHVLWLAACVFIVSLSFRSLDMQFCPNWPLGTHFLWHCCNALVLYFTARAYIVNSALQHKKMGG